MTIQQLKDVYLSVFHLVDTMILEVLIAIVIHSKMKGDAMWLLLVGPSSSGKTELISAISDISVWDQTKNKGAGGERKVVHSISTLSENTFLSNMRSPNGEEASLLHQIGSSGVIAMKDYTTILSMPSEKRDTIAAQLREIYDGYLTKLSGNNNSVEWRGKINWIGGVTDSIFLKEGEAAGMGRRTINYYMPEQNRKETTRRAALNDEDMEAKRKIIQTAFKQFAREKLDNLPKELPDISPEFQEKIIDLADFVTRARTPTVRDFHGKLVLVHGFEMPMRVFRMLKSLARVLIYLNDGVCKPEIEEIITKLAFDSVPKQRWMALKLLAKYDHLTSKGAAQEISYPTDVMRDWLEDINVLQICDRTGGDRGVGPDLWVLKPEYRKILNEYAKIELKHIDLIGKNESVGGEDLQPTWIAGEDVIETPATQSIFEGTDDPGLLKEQKEKEERDWQNFMRT